MLKMDVTQAARAYKFLAYQVFNLVLLILIVNILGMMAFFIYDRTKRWGDERVLSYRGEFADHAAYTRLSSREIDDFLDEQDAFGSLGFRYAPWVQFRNPEFHGRFINTDDKGFRRTKAPGATGQNPLKVHVFGGSTTFGYGVPDDHTIPHYLQVHLQRTNPARSVQVKNFGQGFYYSSQEQMLLLSRLKDGDRPDWAVFIDATNDVGQLSLRHDEPIFTPGVSRLWNASATGEGPARDGMAGLKWIPMVRLAQSIANRLRPDHGAPAQNSIRHNIIRSDAHLSAEERERIVQFIVERYKTNMRVTRAICQEFAIRCLFIWQPHPSYKYDARLHKTFPYKAGIPAYYIRVHSIMEKLESPDFLFLGNLTENETKKVYVDDVHYNEAWNERIALMITEALLAR